MPCVRGFSRVGDLVGGAVGELVPSCHVTQMHGIDRRISRCAVNGLGAPLGFLTAFFLRVKAGEVGGSMRTRSFEGPGSYSIYSLSYRVRMPPQKFETFMKEIFTFNVCFVSYMTCIF